MKILLLFFFFALSFTLAQSLGPIFNNEEDFANHLNAQFLERHPEIAKSVKFLLPNFYRNGRQTDEFFEAKARESFLDELARRHRAQRQIYRKVPSWHIVNGKMVKSMIKVYVAPFTGFGGK